MLGWSHLKAAEYLGVWKAGEGRLEVQLMMSGTGGKGLCGFISGGESAHVGGTAYAVPRKKSSGEGLTADVSIICGPGHKDVYMAQTLAKLISIPTNEAVSLTAGVHVDKASPEELAQLQSNCITVAEEFVKAYCRRA